MGYRRRRFGTHEKPARKRYRQEARRFFNKARNVKRSNGEQMYRQWMLVQQNQQDAPTKVSATKLGSLRALLNDRTARRNFGEEVHDLIFATRPFAGLFKDVCATCGHLRYREGRMPTAYEVWRKQYLTERSEKRVRRQIARARHQLNKYYVREQTRYRRPSKQQRAQGAQPSGDG